MVCKLDYKYNKEEEEGKISYHILLDPTIIIEICPGSFKKFNTGMSIPKLENPNIARYVVRGCGLSTQCMIQQGLASSNTLLSMQLNMQLVRICLQFLI